MSRLKKVDEWWYSVDSVMILEEKADVGVDEDVEPPRHVMGEKKVKIVVSLEKDTDEDKTPPHTLREVNFVVECKECGICMEGTDIECLRAAVWEKLDKKFEIQWFKYYKVDVIQSRIYGDGGTGLEFYWEEVEKGITFDGKELLRQQKRYNRGYDDLYKISAWPGKFYRRDGNHVVACIPMTDAALAGMEDIKRRLDLLREMLEAMLSPDNIMHTLANLSGMKLLPQASEALKDAEEELKAEKQLTANLPAQ